MITRRNSLRKARYEPLERVPRCRSSPYGLPGALHGARNRLEKPVDVLFARGSSKGKPERGARFRGRPAEREKNAARGGRACMTGRARRDRDPLEIEGRDERFGLRAGEERRRGGGEARASDWDW